MRGVTAANVTLGPCLKNPEVREEVGRVPWPQHLSGSVSQVQEPWPSACAAAPQPAVSHIELRTSKAFPELPQWLISLLKRPIISNS